MEAFLPDTVQAILLGLLAIGFALTWLARALPNVVWLRVFRRPAVHISEEQRATQRRSANRQTALEIILAGLALPLLYVVSTVMMFHDFTTILTIIVSACSVSCIALGIWILVRNRER